MAGLGALDAMYQTFLGQTNDALNEPASPWQQELLETVNPQKVKAQNIKRALAQASMALATTPGNFLTGLSAAAGTGANSYLQAQDDAEQNRMKALQLAELANQKQQDRRLQLLHDALGVGRDLKNDKRQETLDARAAKESDARIAYYNNGGRHGSGSTSGVDSAIERRRGQAATIYFRQLDKLREENYGEEPAEEDKDALWGEIQRRFKIQDDAPPADEQVPTSENKSDLTVRKSDTASPAGGILPAQAPPPLEQRIVGKVYATPKGNFIWTGSGWKPAL